jgi:hypothetical protein
VAFRNAGVFFLLLKPFVISQPTMLQPYSIGFRIMGTISNHPSRIPQVVTQQENAEE